jgi:hypothetical protein
MAVLFVLKLVTPVKQMVLVKLSIKAKLRFSLVQKEHKIITTEFCHYYPATRPRIEQDLWEPVSHIAPHGICYHPLDAPLPHIYQRMHKHHDNLSHQVVDLQAMT